LKLFCSDLKIPHLNLTRAISGWTILKFGGSYKGCWYTYICTLWYTYVPYGIHMYLMAIWYILRPFGTYFVAIWYIFSLFGALYQEKSGNPGSEKWTLSADYFLPKKLILGSEKFFFGWNEKNRYWCRKSGKRQTDVSKKSRQMIDNRTFKCQEV
jgi:hypothetical protein